MQGPLCTVTQTISINKHFSPLSRCRRLNYFFMLLIYWRFALDNGLSYRLGEKHRARENNDQGVRDQRWHSNAYMHSFLRRALASLITSTPDCHSGGRGFAPRSGSARPQIGHSSRAVASYWQTDVYFSTKPAQEKCELVN